MATLREASATLIAAPSQGSSALTPAFPSVAATRAFVVPCTRSTAAPCPGPVTVATWTVESYCSKTARREARFGDPRRARSTAPGSIPRSGSWSLATIGAPGAGASRRRSQAIVDDRVGGQGAGRDARELCCTVARTPIGREPARDHDDVALVRDPPDHRAGEGPARADRLDGVQPVRTDDREHPLLALADEDLERLHAGLAPRDRIQVDDDPGARAIGGLGRRARDAGRAEVLQPLDQPALDELERRLDEQLLGKWIADLHRWPLRWIVVRERCGGEDRR